MLARLLVIERMSLIKLTHTLFVTHQCDVIAKWILAEVPPPP